MKTKSILGSFVLAVSVSLCTASVAQHITFQQYSANFPAWYANEYEQNDPTCCGDTVADDYLVSSDFTPAMAAQLDSRTAASYGSHVSIVGPSTMSYNCHGYVFMGSACWEDNPHNWFGTLHPCYKVVSSGSIYRFGSKHSAKAGNSTLPYKGKLGECSLAFHDNYIYGSPTAIWVQR